MGREEGVILPAAQRHLKRRGLGRRSTRPSARTATRSFGGDTDKEYRQLFSRIVNAAPGWANAQSTQPASTPMA